MRSVISRLTSSGCEVRQNESMARHTTFKTGGAADVLCICRSAKSARDAFFYLSENRLPFEVIGGGSNILVSDKGYRGVILKFYGDDFFEDCGEGYFYVSGGAGACKILTRIMAKGYGGAEFAATIPGGIGGHIAMNAGCYGGEMKDITAWVDAAFEDGIKTLNAGSCAFGHRDSIFLKKQCIILGAMLNLKKKTPPPLNKNLSGCF
jgi:UDP-N-acetylmuramate dehydrogenase